MRSHTVPALFWPTVVLPGDPDRRWPLAYPFIEAKLTKDRAHHHLLQRPRDVPVRTSLGAMALTFYIVLFISGGNDLIAEGVRHLAQRDDLGRPHRAARSLPPLAYVLTYRICLGLQRHDREVLEHGVETGIIKLLPTGEFIEVHQPLGPVDDHGHGQLNYAGTPVPKRMNQLGHGRVATRPWLLLPRREKPEIGRELAEMEESEEASDAAERRDKIAVELDEVGGRAPAPAHRLTQFASRGLEHLSLQGDSSRTTVSPRS